MAVRQLASRLERSSQTCRPRTHRRALTRPMCSLQRTPPAKASIQRSRHRSVSWTVGVGSTSPVGTSTDCLLIHDWAAPAGARVANGPTTGQPLSATKKNEESSSPASKTSLNRPMRVPFGVGARLSPEHRQRCERRRRKLAPGGVRSCDPNQAKRAQVRRLLSGLGSRVVPPTLTRGGVSLTCSSIRRLRFGNHGRRSRGLRCRVRPTGVATWDDGRLFRGMGDDLGHVWPPPRSACVPRGRLRRLLTDGRRRPPPLVPSGSPRHPHPPGRTLED